MKPIPEIGKTHNCFDDGKVSHSRLYTVDVKDVVSFNKIDEETKKNWKEKVEQCCWIYAQETDYFVLTENGEDGDAVFARVEHKVSSALEKLHLEISNKLNLEI